MVIDYQFRADSLLEGGPYVLVLNVVYLDGTTNHTETVFNGVVTVTLPSESFINGENLFLLLALSAAVGGAVYYGLNVLNKKKKKADKDSATAQKNAESWLVGTTAASSNKKSPNKVKKN